MLCNECGYLHAPYSVEDVQAEGFMERFLQHQKYMKRLGEKAVDMCKEFFYLHKKRIQLEKYKFKHDKLTESRQKEWDELEPQYLKARDERTIALQAFLDMCKHEKLEVPEWVKKHKWITV